MVALILIAAFVFQPIRNWIQEQLDRYYFYKDRYDYRRTLIEFARELGSPTDLDEMLESVADRLIRTLGIRHVAFFVWDEAEAKFHLELASNRHGRQTENVPYGLDLSFLSAEPGKPVPVLRAHAAFAGRGFARDGRRRCAAPSRNWS